MTIFDLISNYDFIQRAYLAGSFIAMLCAILGIFLILRRLSLIGDGLSHVSFGAIALGLFFGIYPFYIAIPIVVLSSYIISKLAERSKKMYGDTAIGVISSFSIAGGVILASISKGFNVDLLGYLFGNILAINSTEVYLSITLSIIALCVITYFYNDLFSITFDEQYAKISKINTEVMNIILSSVTAITVVLAIKVAGIMLTSSLLILPAITALQIAKGFRSAIIISAIISIISVLIGITISFYADLPTGAVIIMTNFILFVSSLAWKR